MTRMGLRRLWFTMHKWIGLVLMLFLMLLGLTGSILLAYDWVGERAAAFPAKPPLPLSRYLASAQAALPQGARVTQIMLPHAVGDPVSVRASGSGRPQRITLDPATAAPVTPPADIFQTMHRFHETLFVPGSGRLIVGVLGVAMLGSCLTGLWLWWPLAGSVSRGFRWRRSPSTNSNIHHLVGFWIALPLVVLSLSGAWISFVHGGPRGGHTDGGQAHRQPHHGGHQPGFTIDQAAALLSGGGPLADISLPGPGTPWVATLGNGRRIALDDATGAPAAVPTRGSGGIVGWMHRVHEGNASTGPVWRAIVFVTGLAPVILGVTGGLLWWRRRSLRIRSQRRQAATA